mgnify:CR=1 FL=1
MEEMLCAMALIALLIKRAIEHPKRKQIVFADDLTSDEEDASPAKGGDLWKESMF